MTPVLWTAFGMAVGAAVLHTALGVRRPIRWTYLWFAGIMVLLAAFLHFELAIYGAGTVDAAVEAMRRQLVVVYAFLACLFVFFPAYTQVRLSRVVTVVYASALAVLFVVNLVAPYGIWFSASPELHRAEVFGEPYS